MDTIIVDSKAWTPRYLPGLKCWYDASDSSSLTLSGLNVTQWEDKSGLGNHWIQAVSDRQPLYDDTINGRPAVRFLAHRMSTVSSFDYNNHLMLCVSKLSVDSDYIGSGNFDGGAWSMFWQGRIRAHYILAPINDVDSSSSFISGDQCVMGQHKTSTTLSAVANGIYTSSALTGTSLNVYPFSCGRNNITGTMGEVLFCNALCSQSDVDKAVGYLHHNWGLQSSLPMSHPYKNNRPYV